MRPRRPTLADGFRLATRAAAALPAPVLDGLAGLGAAALSLTMRERRAMVARHMRRAIGPHLEGVALERAVQAVFDSYGRYWAEAFRLPSLSAAELDASMSFEGVGRIEAAITAGTGAILAVPHLGGWDFGGAWLASVGYPPTAVVEPLEPPEVFEWFTELRRARDVDVVPLGAEAGSAVLGAIRSNRLVALVCDRDLTGGGVEVELFGERTTIPSGPAVLALRTGAPLLPTAIYYRGRGHHGVVEEPIDVRRSGRLRDDVARVSQDLATALERLIRRAPEQWHLLQPNWPSDHEVLAEMRRSSPAAARR